MRKNNKVAIISLGCSKNLVDSERLAARFRNAGWEVTFDESDCAGAHVVVNTCAFIGDAKEESVNYLLSAAELKKQGKVRSVRLMGCLGQRYREEIGREIPELDAVYGKFDWEQVAADLDATRNAPRPWERMLSTGPHYAYIKISEGCDRFCAFCAIPLITGRHTSRHPDEIVEEVRELAAKGTKEFNIIAQDLSSYGKDLNVTAGGKSPLAQLLERLSDIPGVEMLRLHYAYPSDFPYDILPVMASRPNICKYLDIALQHIDDTVLRNMRRHIDAKATRELLERIRREVPGIHIRTTLMTGFPGEDEEAFGRLLDFVREQSFERMGAFAYCEEEDTFAARNFEDSIPQEVKQERLDRLMAVQQEIAFEHARSMAGRTLRVIVDSEEEEYYEGRTEYDSPEVDCVVYIDKTERLLPGDIVPVKITGCQGFDLTGSVAK